MDEFIRFVEKIGASPPDEANLQYYCSDCFTCIITISRGEPAKTLLVGDIIRRSS